MTKINNNPDEGVAITANTDCRQARNGCDIVISDDESSGGIAEDGVNKTDEEGACNQLSSYMSTKPSDKSKRR
jgi:hypothetical protein